MSDSEKIILRRESEKEETLRKNYGIVFGMGRRTVGSVLAAALVVAAVYVVANGGIATKIDVEERIDLKSYDGFKVLTVSDSTWSDIEGHLRQLESFNEMGERRLHSGEIFMDFLLSSEDWLSLDGSTDIHVRVHDVQPLIDAQRRALNGAESLSAGGETLMRRNRNHKHGKHHKLVPSESWFDDFHPLEAIDEFVDALHNTYPDNTEVTTIGHSVEGKHMRMLKIFGSNNEGENRPAVYFDGGIHAREWITPATVLYVAYHILSSYGADNRIDDLLNAVDVYILPVVNPDGYDLSWTTDRMWRKNKNGVDLNRNFEMGWNDGGDWDLRYNSQTYHGTEPFSEPETSAIRDFVIAHEGTIKAYINFHSYSQLVLRAWSYTWETPKFETTAKHVGDAMAEEIYNTHREMYQSMRAIEFTTAGGCAHDWVSTKVPLAFAIEVRDTGDEGFLLSPEKILPTAQENLAAALFLAEYVRDHTAELSFDDRM